MNHLTNLYKHKCEQLQEQINNMKRMLNEVNAPLPTQGNPSVVPPTGIDPRMFDPELQPNDKPQYRPREYSGPKPPPPQGVTPGSIWYDREGNTWEWRDGAWRFVRGTPGRQNGYYTPQPGETYQDFLRQVREWRDAMNGGGGIPSNLSDPTRNPPANLG
jgi:hypothetical protein